VIVLTPDHCFDGLFCFYEPKQTGGRHDVALSFRRGRNPVFRTIIIIAWLAIPTGVRAETLRDKLAEALKTYCVPPSEQSCSEGMLAR
jgi:hypothetical protein